jgi:hypothetical protein
MFGPEELALQCLNTIYHTEILTLLTVEKWELRNVFGPKIEEVRGNCGKLCNIEVYDKFLGL